MKKAIMYGAGNIGRGFIGEVFSQSGYEVCFIDILPDVIEQINRDHCYPVKVVTNENRTEGIVRNVRAVSGLDLEAVVHEIETADIMATAVGVKVLPKIAGPICEGLKKRFKTNGRPLNIIICENLIDADKYLRKLIEKRMNVEYKDMLQSKLGLVEASIGRMVPVMTEEMKEGNPLRVWVEPYCELPVDKTAFVGDIPELQGLVPFSPFEFHIKRKLYIHNMAHAMLAYLGWQKDYTYIYECAADDAIRNTVAEAMAETSEALHREYGMPTEELRVYTKDLMFRFENRPLGDTVMRVGRDPVRKLGSNDRLVGAALYCEAQGVNPTQIIKGIVAALRYDNPEDKAAAEMHAAIQDQRIEEYTLEACGLKKDSTILSEIVRQYNICN